MIEISGRDFDQLALDNAEIIGFESGSTVSYDVAGYGRCARIEVSPESLPVCDVIEKENYQLPEEASFIDEPYFARLAGFRRRNIFGPDQIGEMFREQSIPWSDGLGNGLFESLLICKKYGLRHVIEAPILGFATPFLEGEWDEFRVCYRKIVQHLLEDLILMEPLYGGKFSGEEINLVVLWARDYPLSNFMKAYQSAPGAVSAELETILGGDVLPIQPKTAGERLKLIRFWNWVREKQARIQIVQADILREELGSGARIIANPHELPVLDFEGQGRAFDIPSVAIRPLLLNDELFLQHYVAYFSQLYHDLTKKLPMVSVRMNLSAASPQFIPSGELIRHWYDQAVRHGAGSFYFWTRDYPPDSDPDTYDGPIPGNPVESTLPAERWETSLDILGQLSSHQRFVQPQAEVAILVPVDSALLNCKEWRRIYTAFSALAEKRIFTQFISDRQIEQDGIPQNVRMIVAPELEFLTSELIQKLETFIKNGGLLLVGSSDFYDPEGKPISDLSSCEKIPPALFDIFPIDKAGSRDKLEQASQYLLDWVEKMEIDPKSWVFRVQSEQLPLSSKSWLRKTDPSVYFAPWQYEHGSEWIMPYLKEIPTDK